MGLRLFTFSLVLSLSLWGQRRFSWQDACFKNPGLPYCQGRDYAVKRTPPAKASPTVVTNPGAVTPRNPTPSLIVVGGLDWQFADPSADALIGIDFGALSASPIARDLIAQLSAKQDQKVIEGLSGLDQIAISIRDNRVVVLVTGRVTDAALPAPESGLKVAPLTGNAMLIGHPDAVDQAVQRIARKAPLSELVRSAGERQDKSDLWAIGSPRFISPEAVSAGVKRFDLTVSLRNRFASDLAFEFDGIPKAGTILAAATVEGNVAHARMSMEPDEVRQKFGQIAASTVGQRLAALVQAAKYLPVPNPTLPKRTKAVIYGLDGGPKEVN